MAKSRYPVVYKMRNVADRVCYSRNKRLAVGQRLYTVICVSLGKFAIVQSDKLKEAPPPKEPRVFS